ncbi:hypothetical protein [Streptomyces sp. NPDC097619]|uniref:hypothetical protein n=1 Tax=Streptomyces sp. NPDC097619 TaxID=3157228 RepID=UPI003329537C
MNGRGECGVPVLVLFGLLLMVVAVVAVYGFGWDRRRVLGAVGMAVQVVGWLAWAGGRR